MLSLALLLAVAGFTLVSPQLAPLQHTALMDLFDALGLKENTDDFFFFFF